MNGSGQANLSIASQGPDMIMMGMFSAIVLVVAVVCLCSCWRRRNEGRISDMEAFNTYTPAGDSGGSRTARLFGASFSPPSSESPVVRHEP